MLLFTTNIVWKLQIKEIPTLNKLKLKKKMNYKNVFILFFFKFSFLLHLSFPFMSIIIFLAFCSIFCGLSPPITHNHIIRFKKPLQIYFSSSSLINPTTFFIVSIKIRVFPVKFLYHRVVTIILFNFIFIFISVQISELGFTLFTFLLSQVSG